MLFRAISLWPMEDDILDKSLWQLEDEELPWFDRTDIVGVAELAAAIKGVGDERQPVRQRDGQIGGYQNHVVAARRSANTVKDEIGTGVVAPPRGEIRRPCFDCLARLPVPEQEVEVFDRELVL